MKNTKSKKSVKKSTDTGLFCGVIPADLAKNPELLRRVNSMSKPKKKAKWEPKLTLEVKQWCVITTWDNEVPEDVLAVLQKDEHVSKINGQWKDLLIYHGDDGGWCVSAGERSRTYRFLEMIRKAVGYDRSGTVFHLHIKSA